MIKIALCDDDIICLKQTSELLKQYTEVPLTLFCFQSGNELLESVEHFDLVLLDIDMPGINGIETGKRIREVDKRVKIIYLTHYMDYALFAFEVHAFAYLLKPIEPKKLFNQLDEALAYLKEAPPSHIEYETLQGIIRLFPKDIYYFEYEKRKVLMKTTLGTYVLNQKISDVAKRMEAFHFFMPHKSFSINLYFVRTIRGYDIHMMEGSIIPLSQKKASSFRHAFNKYLRDERPKMDD